MLKIYGASDDLIEFEGDVDEEAYAKEDGNVIALSNGAVFRIKYSDEGVWRITPVFVTGTSTIEYGEEDSDNNYSDVVTVHEPIKWIVVGTEFRS